MQDTTMLIEILFWLFLVLTCLFCALAGGKAGRAGVALIIAATIATDIAQNTTNWSHTAWPIAAIDAALLVGLYILALKSRAYWPLWATGFHLITVITHIATIIAPGFRFGVYFGFSGIWSLLTLLAMVIGVAADHRASHNRRAEPAPTE
ncbi:MAG: hypothetical protein IPP23_11385 [Sphingomonadales bacterium]|nr:hypothetical protein [Sphingomonadales bacterium]